MDCSVVGESSIPAVTNFRGVLPLYVCDNHKPESEKLSGHNGYYDVIKQ